GGVFSALADPAGVTAHRPGALERVHLAMSDWQDTRQQLADAEARMTAVLDDLGLIGLVTTIGGLTPVGAAAILAETGDPDRFASPRSLVKPARPCPRPNTPGPLEGKPPGRRRGAPRVGGGAGGGVGGRPAKHPGDPRPVPPPAPPPGHPAGPPAGPHRLRRCPAALAPRRHHRAGGLGPCHRR